MRIKLIIDRFESDKAVLLAGDAEAAVIWPRGLLPAGAEEGDVLSCDLEVDPEATRRARQEAEELLQQLTKNKC